MRLHLIFAIITVVALVITLRAEKRHHFAFSQVEKMAQARAAAKYVPMPDVLPSQLKKLTPQQDAGIFPKVTSRLWRRKGLPFQIDFYPQLNSNPQPHLAPKFNYVDSKGSHQLPYSPTLFNFLDVTVNPAVPLVFSPPLPDNLGYAGFYARYPDMGIGSNPTSLDGFFSVLGGNYFRVLAKEQVYGLSARGIAINTSVDNKPEEFPNFCEWWLREPDPNATELTLDALLDGPSVTGAYEFKVRPGAVTSVDVHASLFFRQPVDRLGIAPFSSMYLYGENAKEHFGDKFHPEVHDSDGVLLNTGGGEWIWRPLGQSNDPDAGPTKGMQLQLYNFIDKNPKGFGLLQRDRDFQHYQDLQMKYNVRPSAWVTPHGDWGSGTVQLIQHPSTDVNFDNVVLFWHPDQAVKAGDHLDLSYTIDFYMNDATRPPLAYTKQTLVYCPAPPPPAPPLPGSSGGRPPVTPPPATTVATTAKPAPPSTNSPSSTPPSAPAPVPPTGTVPVQFVIDFAGNGIENTPVNQPPDLDLTYAPQGTFLREKSVEKNGYDNSWRVTFTIFPFKHNVPTELRCRLLHGNKPLTETWSYTWHQ
jgi:periplasmic glucans biosynthesis protein